MFEIADYAYNAIGDFSTFTLKADGKPFYVTKANGNALSGNVTDVTTVTNIFTVEGKVGFYKTFSFEFGWSI